VRETTTGGFFRRTLVRYPALALGLLVVPGCGDGPDTSEFPPIYFALVHGVVTQGGAPAAGVPVQVEVRAPPCPPAGEPLGSAQATTDDGGHYRLFLTSSSADAGQCVSLRAANAADPTSVPEVYVVPSRRLKSLIYHAPGGRRLVTVSTIRSGGREFHNAWRLLRHVAAERRCSRQTRSGERPKPSWLLGVPLVASMN
jgi:hypothetical protein